LINNGVNFLHISQEERFTISDTEVQPGNLPPFFPGAGVIRLTIKQRKNPTSRFTLSNPFSLLTKLGIFMGSYLQYKWSMPSSEERLV
jgi:hypothetical protein